MHRLTCAECGGTKFELAQDEQTVNAERIQHVQSLATRIGEYYSVEITCVKCKAKHEFGLGSD